jgi:hypothetical protein
MVVEGKATEADLGLLTVTDSPAEARDIILGSTGGRPGGAAHEEQAREETRRALGRATGPEA